MKNNPELILLTYKGKALLMYQYENSIDEENHEWTFVNAVKKNNESTKNALSRSIMNETGIKIDKIEYLGKNYYHARLTDNEVNNIKRDELQLLNFFTLSEVQELRLHPSTRNFVNQFGNLI